MPVRFMRDSEMITRAIPESNFVAVAIDANSVDQWVFVASHPCEVVSVKEIHAVAGNDGSAVTADVVKASGTTVVGSGTTVLASTFDLKSTTDTLVSKTAASGLTATVADRKLAAGDRLGINFGGTLTTLAGGVLQIELKRLETAGGSR